MRSILAYRSGIGSGRGSDLCGRFNEVCILISLDGFGKRDIIIAAQIQCGFVRNIDKVFIVIVGKIAPHILFALFGSLAEALRRAGKLRIEHIGTRSVHPEGIAMLVIQRIVGMEFGRSIRVILNRQSIHGGMGADGYFQRNDEFCLRIQLSGELHDDGSIPIQFHRFSGAGGNRMEITVFDRVVHVQSRSFRIVMIDHESRIGFTGVSGRKQVKNNRLPVRHGIRIIRYRNGIIECIHCALYIGIRRRTALDNGDIGKIHRIHGDRRRIQISLGYNFAILAFAVPLRIIDGCRSFVCEGTNLAGRIGLRSLQLLNRRVNLDVPGFEALNQAIALAGSAIFSFGVPHHLLAVVNDLKGLCAVRSRNGHRGRNTAHRFFHSGTNLFGRIITVVRIEAHRGGNGCIIGNTALQIRLRAHAGCADLHLRQVVIRRRSGITGFCIGHEGDPVIRQDEILQGLVIRIDMRRQFINDLPVSAQQALHPGPNGCVLRIRRRHRIRRIGIVNNNLRYGSRRFAVDVVQIKDILVFRIEIQFRGSVRRNHPIPMNTAVVLVHGIVCRRCGAVNFRLNQDINLPVIPALAGLGRFPCTHGGFGMPSGADRRYLTLRLVHRDRSRRVAGEYRLRRTRNKRCHIRCRRCMVFRPLVDGILHLRVALRTVAGNVVLHDHRLQITHVIEAEVHIGFQRGNLVSGYRLAVVVDGDRLRNNLRTAAIVNLDAVQAHIFVRIGNFADRINCSRLRKVRDRTKGGIVLRGIGCLGKDPLPGIVCLLLINLEGDLSFLLDRSAALCVIQGSKLLDGDLPALAVLDILQQIVGTGVILLVVLRGQADINVLGGIRQERIRSFHLADHIIMIGGSCVSILVGQREEYRIVPVHTAIRVAGVIGQGSAPVLHRNFRFRHLSVSVRGLCVNLEFCAGDDLPLLVFRKRIIDGIFIVFGEGDLTDIELIFNVQLQTGARVADKLILAGIGCVRNKRGPAFRSNAVDVEIVFEINGFAVEADVCPGDGLIQIIGRALAVDIVVVSGRLDIHPVRSALVDRTGTECACVRSLLVGIQFDFPCHIGAEIARLDRLLRLYRIHRTVLSSHRDGIIGSGCEQGLDFLTGSVHFPDGRFLRNSGNPHVHAAVYDSIIHHEVSICIKDTVISRGYRILNKCVDTGVAFHNLYQAVRSGGECLAGVLRDCRPFYGVAGAASRSDRLKGVTHLRGSIPGRCRCRSGQSHIHRAVHRREGQTVDVKLRSGENLGFVIFIHLFQVNVDESRVLDRDGEIHRRIRSGLIPQGRRRNGHLIVRSDDIILAVFYLRILVSHLQPGRAGQGLPGVIGIHREILR